MEKSDTALIQQCLNGDTEAFSELVSKYKTLIYTVAYRIVLNAEDANDLAQESFLKIYKSLDRYNPEYKFSTWISKITVNVCLDWKRTQRPTQELQPCHTDGDAIDTVSADYEQAEQRQILQAAVASLPIQYQKPLVLFHQVGMSYQDIMAVLNEPVSIVKNRLYRARLMLKDKLIQQRKDDAL